MQTAELFQMLVDRSASLMTARYATNPTDILKPLQCSVSIMRAPTHAEIVARDQGGCFLFHTSLGKVPFTAHGAEARHLVLDVMQKLNGEMKTLLGNIDLVLNHTGDVQARSRIVTDKAPNLQTFFTALASYAQELRPYLLELQPLLIR